MNKKPEASTQQPGAVRRVPFWLLASGFWLLCPGFWLLSSAHAQGVNPQSLYGHDTTQGVYVRDSAVAVEKFALAERMEHLREWDKSADVYMEILKNYSDRVVPSQIDKDNKIYQYTSVTPAVQERLAKWPADGLAAYTARFEGEASALLEAAGDDPAKLHHIVSFYFVTNSAKRAAMRLIDLYLERGEFPAAAWTGQRLLDWHPGLNDDERAKVLYRVALAYHLVGNDEQAQARLAELHAKFPQTIGTICGKDVVLADSLANELGAAQVKLATSSAESWPMAFGSPDRSRIARASSFGGARLFGIDVARPSIRGLPLQQRRDLASQDDRDRASGSMTGIFPVVDRGELFFQDNAHVYAVSLESGLPLPGWAQTYDGERDGHFTLPSAWPTPRAQQCTLTLTEDSVLAIMGQPDMIAMGLTNTFGQRDTRLVCLDRRDGKQKWISSPRQFPDSASNLRSLDLSGSPLVVGNTVYVQARGGKGMQFEDSYVVAFDLTSGRLKWACYIASANSGTLWDGDMGAVLSQNVSHLAYSSGRVYALTNLGAVAAIDAYDGTIVWLNIYPRDVVEPGRNFAFNNWNRRASQSGSSSDKPWSYNPVIVSNGKLFILPTDGLNLHIYDAGTGIEIKRILLSQFENAQTLLGVVDDKLIVATDRQVFCIDWANYDPSRRRVDNLVWATNALVRGGSAEDSIRGRGFVTADSVIIPTAWQLLRLSLRNGAIMQAYPPGAGASWGEDEGPGNILVTQDRLIIAGPDRVNVYTDLALAMKKLDAAVAAAPDDPAPRLRYAEIMFVAGKLDLAVTKLDEAISLLSNGAAAHPAERDRIFTTALTFAQKLAKDERAKDNADLVAGLFDRAGAAASTPSQKVNYRLNRAAFDKQLNQPQQELKLYQEILSDADMRAVLYPDLDGDPTAAAAIAKRGIDEIIKQAGVEIYAPYERAAADMLTRAQASADPEQLQAIAQAYPNSSAALQALLSAADIYENASNPRRATQVLRQAYLHCTDDASQQPQQQQQRLRILESLARNYLLMPNRVDVAIARLKQAARSNPSGGNPRLAKPLVLPDGNIIQNVSLSEAATALSQYSAAATSRDLPDVALPALPPLHHVPGKPAGPRPRISAFLPEAPDSTISGVATLLTAQPDCVRNDRVVTFAPSVGLRVYTVGTAQPIGTCDAITQTPAGIAWVGQDNLLVWTDSELFYLSSDASHVLWKASIKTLPQVQMIAQAGGIRDAEDGGEEEANGPEQRQQRAQAMRQQIIINGMAAPRVVVRAGQRIIIQQGGRVQIVPVAVPQMLGQPQVPQPAQPGVEEIAHVRPLSDRIIFDTTHGRIIALDLDGGKLLWQTRLSDRGPTHLLANDDFVVARVASDENGINVQLVALDSYSGQVLSRRNFGLDSGVGMVPVNLALSADGTLVFLLPDRVCIKDLFEPGGIDKAIEVGNRRNDGSMPFQSSVAPDQLQISGERIFVMADDGRTVQMYSLRDGSALRFNQSDTGLSLGPGAVGGRAIMRVVGPHLYIATQREVRGYDVQRQGTPWALSIGARTALTVRDLIVARNHVIALTEPAGPRARRQPNQPANFLRVWAFSRAPDSNGDESGVLEHDVELTDNAAILQWQAVDGGFYYLGGDQQLHFLRGARGQ